MVLKVNLILTLEVPQLLGGEVVHHEGPHVLHKLHVDLPCHILDTRLEDVGGVA